MPLTNSRQDLKKHFSSDVISDKIIYFIEGETGTGKSELCMYLKFKLKEELSDLIIIEISKDLSWFQICGESLPKEYSNHFKEDLPESNSFENFKRDIQNEDEIERISSTFSLKIT